MQTYIYLTYALWIALGAAVGFFVYHLVKWLAKDQVFAILGAKIAGNMEKVSSLRRKALAQKLQEDRAGVADIKFSSWDKLFRFIGQTGILDKIPGANEASVLAGVILLLLGIGLAVSVLAKSILLGLIVVAVVLIAIVQVSRTIIGHRKMKIDSELLPFINSCMSSAAGQADIISIFQDIYPSMDEPLRSMLETCVAEANATNNKQMAIRHLSERSASDQFYATINNLYLCSETSGEYGKTIRALSKTLIVYNNTLEKKKAILRNARVNGAMLAGMGIVAIVSCNGFYAGFLNIILHNTISLAIMAAMVVIAILALTISAD